MGGALVPWKITPTHFLWGPGTINPGSVTTSYNVNGYVVSVSQSGGNPQPYRKLIVDSQGLIQRKVEGTNVQHFFYANGRAVGTTGTDPNKQVNFDYNYQDLTPNTQNGEGYSLTGAGGAAMRHTVSAGDSLPSIAAAYYGDAAKWYLIADANGLIGNEALNPGMQLSIPTATVTNVRNAADTFKPYRPGEIVGDTTPQMKYVPPPTKEKCRALSILIAVAVSVVVSIYAGPVVGAMAGEDARQTSAALLNDRFDWRAVARTIYNPTNTQQYLDHFVLGAHHSGVEGGFDYEAVAIAGAAAYVGSTVGAAFSESTASVWTAGFQPTGATAGLTTSSINSAIAGAAAANLASQGLNLAFDRQEQFSWGSLAGSVASAGVSRSQIASQASSPMLAALGSLAGQYVRILVDGEGKLDWVQVAADAFGNALGNSIVGALREPNSDNRQVVEPDKDDIAKRLEKLHQQGIQLGDRLASSEGVGRPAAVMRGAFNLDNKEELRAAALLVSGLEQGRYDAETAIDIVNDATTFNEESLTFSVAANRVARGVYDQYLSATQKLYADEQTPEDRNRFFTQKYAEVFANDPVATWFGLAAIASGKVGEGLMFSATGNAALSLPGVQGINNLDEPLAIIHRGLSDGNRAVFDSQYTAYQMYRDAGIGGIESVFNAGAFGDTRNDSVRAILRGYQAHDRAAAAFKAGDASYSRHADMALRQLATYEQRVVLQPIYDQSYQLRQSDGSLYERTFRGAILDSARSWLPDPTTVNVVGTRLSFGGSDVGDPDQRMGFVNQLADTFMARYNQASGHDVVKRFHLSRGFTAGSGH